VCVHVCHTALELSPHRVISAGEQLKEVFLSRNTIVTLRKDLSILEDNVLSFGTPFTFHSLNKSECKVKVK
jgi:hypothetical protein